MGKNGTLEQFLLEAVGYGKLGQVMKGEKPLGKSVAHFMRNTILGSYGKSVTCYDVSKSNLPVIPTICRAEGPQGGQDGLRYGIESSYMFREWSPKQIAEFVKEFSQRLFPGCEVSEKNINREDKNRSLLFSVNMRYDGFGVSVSGYHSGIEHRRLSAHFNSGHKFVEQINSDVFRYMQVRELPFPEPLKVFSKKDVESLSAEPVADVSLLELVKKSDEELLNSIRERRPPLYDGGTYKPGSLMAHLNFGFGIVTCANKDMASVYFPLDSEKKTLLCRN